MNRKKSYSSRFRFQIGRNRPPIFGFHVFFGGGSTTSRCQVSTNPHVDDFRSWHRWKRHATPSLFGRGQLQYGEGNHSLPKQADATVHPLVMLAATTLATDWFSKTTSAKKKRASWHCWLWGPRTGATGRQHQCSKCRWAVTRCLWWGTCWSHQNTQMNGLVKSHHVCVCVFFQSLPSSNHKRTPSSNHKITSDLCVCVCNLFLLRAWPLARDSLPRRQQARRESFARMIYSYLFAISSGGCGWCRALGIWSTR